MATRSRSNRIARSELKDALGTPASVPTVWRAVQALGLTVKKNVRPSEHDRPDVAAARGAWHAGAPTWDPTRLVFLDETGITTNLLRRYGRATRGTRVHDHTAAMADQYVSRRSGSPA